MPVVLRSTQNWQVPVSDSGWIHPKAQDILYGRVQTALTWTRRNRRNLFLIPLVTDWLSSQRIKVYVLYKTLFGLMQLSSFSLSLCVQSFFFFFNPTKLKASMVLCGNNFQELTMRCTFFFSRFLGLVFCLGVFDLYFHWISSCPYMKGKRRRRPVSLSAAPSF